MPHKCNNCNTIYPDGCEDILQGCTECGNKKFQYIPDDSVTEEATEPALQDTSEPDLKPSETISENDSQAKARTDIVDKSELPDSKPTTNAESDKLVESDEPQQIESILNDQFEGITVVERGKYELNLSELFTGESKIIKIQEDGKYVVDVTETFKGL